MMPASWITRRWKRCASAPCGAYRPAKPRSCRAILEDRPPYDIRMAGAVSARWMGSVEGQAAFRQTAQTGYARHAMDLQHHNAEESAATEVRVRAVDARYGGKADQGQVWCRVECQFGWSAAGA